ncbi:MAG: tRNA preQ1(34) S-adenosylmethionine ribosyltransferase-isomerase QueA [Acidiphilium sp. 37-64-53]|uniref:tRNA preQ1(34) S-adenosylmethionine ribosyltransferase-isomerase QueA n=1 Tax=Acidiphilium TaxID=522 RepID=UPI000BC55249|nr:MULTISPECIES: tRNA preQ1(34) S-adenosylmethionine ribosyltransferase-isomerase QueA [Acidiphilium]OYW03633.1 MAG: tRNA preQ1(34) S-adenosylmethionine ribosyltransferase-isomerase QueA [Acidiphilium sp. 37-64-53]OZB29730.1 MAG: tRNA preQ1(34) S-adenosylmethionine ribosyltransferase-isomerase QueA [Acidiphilium sp. 34-64-41]HQT84273.1 tRNA preQ1(34) S-adenosylmethionine ribosyltransferase-isomerase QueA [Acidiphilium rubrum]
MNLADFDYALPAERIAAEPARPRDAARLLHVTQAELHDCRIADLPELLRRGDCLVVNDTRVIPAQLTGRRGDAVIGITLDRPMDDGTWRVLLRNARRARPGETITIDRGEGLTATVVSRADDGAARLRFNAEGDAFRTALDAAGALALPPYIPRDASVTTQDQADYQTMFAAHEGAVAAPTAGLHFTPALLEALAAKGITTARVTLHVGAGTFLPVRTETLADHRMHAERGIITAATAAAINAARTAGGRIVAVGTTSLRVLETAAAADGTIMPWSGETDLFILPGYRFRAVDRLLTNFHLPRSTLLMLVAAFAGHDRIKTAYQHAIAQHYRFYSYGDACLLEPA